MIRPPPRSTLFPYPPLFRSDDDGIAHERLEQGSLGVPMDRAAEELGRIPATRRQGLDPQVVRAARRVAHLGSSVRDRKSTRLNSSHDQISYAVFCLKKKKHT